MAFVQTMKTIFSVLVFTVTVACSEDFTTTTGKAYKGATVSRVEADGIIITTEDGIVKLRFADLPPDVAKRFGYDPQKAAAFAAENARAAAANNVAASAAARRDAEQRKTAAAVGDMKKTGRRAELKIVQVLANGILATGVIDNPDGSGFAYKTPFFVACATGGLTDGQRVEQMLYEFGVHKYTDVTGAGRTVKAYAISPDDAVRMARAGDH